MKCALDLLLLVPLRLIAAPIVLLAALAVRAVSPGNPFHHRDREGKAGRGFRMWTLRTMYLEADALLWKVARGEMSFVGPRPFPDYHLDAFDERFRSLRREVLPGLTGLWQVVARADSDLALQEELDTLYIANWSLWMDVYLIARTPWSVLRGDGAY